MRRLPVYSVLFACLLQGWMTALCSRQVGVRPKGQLREGSVRLEIQRRTALPAGATGVSLQVVFPKRAHSLWHSYG